MNTELRCDLCGESFTQTKLDGTIVHLGKGVFAGGMYHSGTFADSDGTRREFNCLKRKRSLNERDARSRRAGVAARAPCCTNDELSRAAKQLNDLNNRLSQFVIEIGQLESTLAGVIIQRGRSTQRRSKHNA